jgi:hypothetical protein
MKTKTHTARRMMRRINQFNIIRNIVLQLIITLRIFLKMFINIITKPLNHKRLRLLKIAQMLMRTMMNLTLRCQSRTVSHSSTQTLHSTTSEDLLLSILLRPHKWATNRHNKANTCLDQLLDWSNQCLRSTCNTFLVKTSSSIFRDKWSRSSSKWNRWC